MITTHQIQSVSPEQEVLEYTFWSVAGPLESLAIIPNGTETTEPDHSARTSEALQMWQNWPAS